MPLNYASWKQVSGWRFWFGRLPIIGMCCVLAFFNPAGPLGITPVLADPASGGLYEAPGRH
jgi:hypothetical protein